MGRTTRPAMVIAALATASCTTTYHVARPANERQRADLLTRAAAGEELPAVPAGAPTAPTDADRGFEIKRHGRGALEGLGIGVLVSAALGGLGGLMLGDDGPCQSSPESCSGIRFSANEKAAAGALVFSLPGALIGTIIGAVVGHKDRYLF
ncbi:MAG TPA: hypothetical protein VHU40_07555 [Polyangia bacterium]|nr:hypothetical protein [Polyangia bacterium]